MARAALVWNLRDFAAKSGVGFNTIMQFEKGANARASTIEKLRSTFEKAGVEFIDENGSGPGVRLRKRRAAKRGRKAKDA